MKIKRKLISLIVLFIICLIAIPCYAKEGKKTSIYMWEINNIDYEKYDKMVDYLNINKIYAYIGTANLNDKIDSDVIELFQFAKRKNIEIYVVYDENYEDQTENERRIKELIEEIKEYNQTSAYKINGLAIDSEFHCLDGYGSLSKQEQVQLFRNYVTAMKNAYSSANEADLDYVVCIPVWLNKLDEGLLEELIQNGCSYVQLMNYSKNNMTQNISEEVAFARQYNKKIENIAEFQIPGPHEVTDNETFYNDGLEAGINKFQEIDEYYNYDSLTFSFHYYTPVIELFNNITIENDEEEPKQENYENNTNNTNNNVNNNEITNETKEEKENVTNKEEKSNIDNTKAGGVIPQTGETKYVVFGLLFVIATIGIVSLVKIKMISKKE